MCGFDCLSILFLDFVFSWKCVSLKSPSVIYALDRDNTRLVPLVYTHPLEPVSKDFLVNFFKRIASGGYGEHVKEKDSMHVVMQERSTRLI